MNADRWRRVSELFDEAVTLPRAGREEWLRHECGPDAEMLAEVLRLLGQDERADIARFLEPPDAPQASQDQSSQTTATYRPGFTPFQAIQSAHGSSPTLGSQDRARDRLRELATTCIAITLLIVFWKFAIVGDPDYRQAIPYLGLIAALIVQTIFLRRSRLFRPSTLEFVELGMISAVAAVYAFAQYQTMLDFSLRGDPTRVQVVYNHRVLISAVLILSYGVSAPANWRRAAAVLGIIAILPACVAVLLQLRHPGAIGWTERIGRQPHSTPLSHYGFDTALLLILAAWSSHGAYTINLLRRQAREARRLGQYRLLGPLGSGGMGEVHLAEHQFLKRPCALKVIRTGAAMDAKTLSRFEREVRITAELSHPNTIEIYDYGRTEEGEYYYVMEYLPGLSLDELVRRHGPLPPGRVVHLLRQVCGALAEAHAARLVHRDIKPSNLFATRRGGVDDVAKVLDFGLVRPIATDRSIHLSEEGQILGTPSFMAPEQAVGGREVDGRADIYSLGAVAFHLLTGRPPFVAGGAVAVLIAVARDPAPPPSSLRPEIPDDLDRVVLNCLAKTPDDRFPDALALERALAACTSAGEWNGSIAADWWRTHEPNAMAAPAARQDPGPDA